MKHKVNNMKYFVISLIQGKEDDYSNKQRRLLQAKTGFLH